MPQFKYKALDKKGESVKGFIYGEDKKSAITELKKKGLVPVSLAESIDGEEKDVVKKMQGGGEAVALMFFRKMRQLCAGGLPPSDAVRSLGDRSLDLRLKKLARETYKEMSEGKTLSISLSQYKDTFDSCVIHLIEAGESTANLIPVFDNIIEYLEDRRTLRRKVTEAIAYPIFLSIVALSLVLFFLFYLMPKIQEMMANLGGEMSLPVKILIGLGNFLLYFGPFIVIGVALGIFGLSMYRATPKGKLTTDRIYLRMPLLGWIINDADTCRIANLCETLFDSGVTATEAFRLTEKAIKNEAIRERFNQFRTAVNDGASISASFKKYKILSDEDIDIVNVGESTGTLVNCFRELRKTHFETLNDRIKRATTILSSITLGSAFVLVFIFALGIVSSVMNIGQTLSK